jgi:hypothetical protein
MSSATAALSAMSDFFFALFKDSHKYVSFGKIFKK